MKQSDKIGVGQHRSGKGGAVRAVVMREFGPPEVLEPAEVATAEAGPGQVVIEVELANITFVETQVRAGKPPHPAMLPALPAILGNGVGGTVAGRRVVASLNGTGGYAERVAVDAGRPVQVPDGLALRDAVALAGQERKLAVARELGAEVAVDYRREDWPGQVREAAGQVDVVFDGVGGDIGRAAFGLLGAGGRFCPFGMASGSFAPVTPELARARQVTLRAGAAASPEELAALARTALAEAAAGRLRPVIGQEFELAAAAHAHAAIEARTTVGKTLLTVPR
jgi:NADPH:quinone reductase